MVISSLSLFPGVKFLFLRSLSVLLLLLLPGMYVYSLDLQVTKMSPSSPMP